MAKRIQSRRAVRLPRTARRAKQPFFAKEGGGQTGINDAFFPSVASAPRGGLRLHRRPLNAAEEQAAINFTNAHYNEASRRVLQVIGGTGVDGIFGILSARAVSDFQTAAGIPDHGRADELTLNQMVPNRVSASRHEHAIQLVLDFFNLDTSNVLAVRFDPSAIRLDFSQGFFSPQVIGADTTFMPGNQRVIRVSALPFADAGALRDAIRGEINRPEPAVPAAGPAPNRLTATEQVSAIQYMRTRYTDARSVRILQGHLGANLTGVIDGDLVQRVAEAQHTAGLGAVDGKVGDDTLEHFFTQLRANGQHDAAIRLIVDLYNLGDDDNLLQIFFDPTVGANASTDFRPNEPVRIRVGPAGISQPYAGVVHTIAHEYEHVRRLKEGIVSAATHEFLGEAIEILSVGMPEEALESTAPGTPGHVFGFANDASRGLNNWNNMPLADRRTFWWRFRQVRRRVLQRIDAGTPAQQALHAGLRANYVAVPSPF
jgi:peptidoglycan hydrolase-like protein with peptidoglycan-binding domain